MAETQTERNTDEMAAAQATTAPCAASERKVACEYSSKIDTLP